jgi:hypothetical protein
MSYRPSRMVVVPPSVSRRKIWLGVRAKVAICDALGLRQRRLYIYFKPPSDISGQRSILRMSSSSFIRVYFSGCSQVHACWPSQFHLASERNLNSSVGDLFSSMFEQHDPLRSAGTECSSIIYFLAFGSLAVPKYP